MAALGVRAFDYDLFALICTSRWHLHSSLKVASVQQAGGKLAHAAHTILRRHLMHEIAAVLQDAAQAAPPLLLKLFRKIVIRLNLGDKAKSIGSWLF